MIRSSRRADALRGGRPSTIRSSIRCGGGTSRGGFGFARPRCRRRILAAASVTDDCVPITCCLLALPVLLGCGAPGFGFNSFACCFGRTSRRLVVSGAAVAVDFAFAASASLTAASAAASVSAAFAAASSAAFASAAASAAAVAAECAALATLATLAALSTAAVHEGREARGALLDRFRQRVDLPA